MNYETSLELNFWEIFNIWQIKRAELRTMRLETARIYFLGDDFATIAVVAVT